MTVNQKASSDWLVTLRPRVGMLISNYLVYGTAGVALAQEKGEFSFSSTYNNSESGSFNRTKFGWVAGAGLERKFSQNLSQNVQPPFYVPVICGFTKHVSGTGGRMPRA